MVGWLGALAGADCQSIILSPSNVIQLRANLWKSPTGSWNMNIPSGIEHLQCDFPLIGRLKLYVTTSSDWLEKAIMRLSDCSIFPNPGLSSTFFTWIAPGEANTQALLWKKNQRVIDGRLALLMWMCKIRFT